MHWCRANLLAIASLAVAASAPDARGLDMSDDLDASVFASRASSPPRLTLTFVDCAELPGEMLAAVQAETAALITALGVAAETRTQLPGSELDPAALTLIVMNTSAPGRLSRGVMGAVQRRSTIRSLWIFPENVAAGARLGWKARNRWSVREREIFSKAMGRVAFHELVHLICPWRGHDGRGLMAGVLDNATLTGSAIPFTRGLRRDFARGVDALAGVALPVAGTQPAGRPDGAQAAGYGALGRSDATQ